MCFNEIKKKAPASGLAQKTVVINKVLISITRMKTVKTFLPHCVNGRRTSLMESKNLLKLCTFSCPLVGTGLECLHWSVFMRSQPLSSRWWRPGLVDNSKIRSPWQRRCLGPNEEDVSSEKSQGKKWSFSTGQLEGSSRLEIKLFFPSLKFQDVRRKKAGNITAVNHLGQSTMWVWRDGWIKVGRVAFKMSILDSCSSIVPRHFKPIRFLQQKSASAGFSCPLIPQKKTKEDDIKKQKPTANTEEVSIDAAAAAEPSRRHVLLTWPLPPTGSRELSQPASTRLHYRNSIGLLECNSLASPCQIPSFFFSLPDEYER